ncbi:DUF6233 domain-containing protein [Streptomyces sp. NPDC057616]|uniref:DUF6233 domain-containing protein n=1 Tax=Streptomyces sp. NPDC057616 TaxID=3346183 RepID=UPI003688A51D
MRQSHRSGRRRRRTIGRDEARRLLADGLRACTHCRPRRGWTSRLDTQRLHASSPLTHGTCYRATRR